MNNQSFRISLLSFVIAISTFVASGQNNASSAAPLDATSADIIIENARSELQQLQRDLEVQQKKGDYQDVIRRFFGTHVKELRFAAYINQCVEKIEQVGTLNYPKEAIRAKLYGRVQLSMAIKSDGSLERVDINHSSGYKILDDAAKHIAFLSSPFNKFPDEIKKDTDVIEITRTWTFERRD